MRKLGPREAKRIVWGHRYQDCLQSPRPLPLSDTVNSLLRPVDVMGKDHLLSLTHLQVVLSPPPHLSDGTWALRSAPSYSWSSSLSFHTTLFPAPDIQVDLTAGISVCSTAPPLPVSESKGGTQVRTFHKKCLHRSHRVFPRFYPYFHSYDTAGAPGSTSEHFIWVLHRANGIITSFNYCQYLARLLFLSTS